MPRPRRSLLSVGFYSPRSEPCISPSACWACRGSPVGALRSSGAPRPRRPADPRRRRTRRDRRGFARLLESDAQLLGGIAPVVCGSGARRRKRQSAASPKRPAQPCQQSAHSGDATLSAASCLVFACAVPAHACRRGRLRPRGSPTEGDRERERLRDSAHAGPRPARGAAGGDRQAHTRPRRKERRQRGTARMPGAAASSRTRSTRSPTASTTCSRSAPTATPSTRSRASSRSTTT